ncbi:MAG: methionine--tRNA ligase subunit beta [Candidatus Pacebacteria bacterium]|nr:methionine--tRNA ligase subunit beta [Candidatus Paceibacterota bacterium]
MQETENNSPVEQKKDYLTIDEFAKLEARIGLVLSAEAVDGSDKLIRFMLDFGEEKPRQILSGIKAWYEPETLVGKKMLFVINLAPRKMMGLESQGMLMAVDGLEGQPVFLIPEDEVAPGAKVR